MDAAQEKELREKLARAANTDEGKKLVRFMLANMNDEIERAFAEGQRVAVHGEMGAYISGAGPVGETGRRTLLRDEDGTRAYLVFIGPRPPKTQDTTEK